MEPIGFTWDAKKARTNKTRHGVSFSEAQSAFFDPYAEVGYDPEHSQDEDRFILIGMSIDARVLVVCHCLQEQGEVIRIISARKADRLERVYYSNQRGE